MCYQSSIEEVQPQLEKYIKRRIFNEADAQDVIQLSNEVLINKESLYDPSRPFSSWALGIARFQIKAYLTRRSRDSLSHASTIPIDADLPLNPDWLADVPFAEIIKTERVNFLKALDRNLGAQEKMVFNLLVDGHTVREIAEAMSLPTPSVSVYKSRLIAKIRKLITPNSNDI
tara:strand:- start:3011 stop:3529 length:519 start_codon:yes stop_codon:yes gene_type:complete